MSDAQYCEAFVAVVDLADSLGVSKINQIEGCWAHRIDPEWWIAVNGHREPVESPVSPLSGVTTTVEPYSVFVEYRGWPAGIIDPFGGAFAAGAVVNEDAFLVAITAARDAIVTRTATDDAE